MSMLLIRRKAIVPVWVVVFGLVTLYGSPMPAGTGVLLLLAGIIVPAIMLILWQKRSPTVAKVPRHVKRHEPSTDVFGRPREI